MDIPENDWHEINESKLLNFAREQQLDPNEFMGELTTNLVNMTNYLLKKGGEGVDASTHGVVFHVIKDGQHTSITIVTEPMASTPPGKMN